MPLDQPIPFDGNITADGNGFLGMTAPVLKSTGGTPQAIATGNTVVVGNVGKVRLNPAGVVTGIIMPVGQYDGQLVTLLNIAVAANTIAFAVAGTSNVADGATTAIAGVTGRMLQWDATAALWFKVSG